MPRATAYSSSTMRMVADIGHRWYIAAAGPPGRATIRAPSADAGPILLERSPSEHPSRRVRRAPRSPRQEGRRPAPRGHRCPPSSTATAASRSPSSSMPAPSTSCGAPPRGTRWWTSRSAAAAPSPCSSRASTSTPSSATPSTSDFFVVKMTEELHRGRAHQPRGRVGGRRQAWAARCCTCASMSPCARCRPTCPTRSTWTSRRSTTSRRCSTCATWWCPLA